MSTRIIPKHFGMILVVILVEIRTLDFTVYTKVNCILVHAQYNRNTILITTQTRDTCKLFRTGGLFKFSGHICMEKIIQSYGVTLKIGGLQPPCPPFPPPMNTCVYSGCR